MQQRSGKQKLAFLKADKFKWLDRVAIVLLFWLTMLPYPYRLVFTIVLVLPWIGFILKKASGLGFESFISKQKVYKGKTIVNMESLLFIPGPALLIRVLCDFQLESVYRAIETAVISFVLICCMLFLLFNRIAQANTDRFRIYLLVFVNMLIYSYSASVGVNCVFDYSKTISYASRINNKYIAGKNTRFYLTVEPWGNHKENSDISVTSKQYHEENIGQRVKIAYHRGLLGIPWYGVE